MISIAEAVAVVRLAWEAMIRVSARWQARTRARAVERELDAAWREALKGGSADIAAVEAALSRARLAGPLSASGRRLQAALCGLRPSPVRRVRACQWTRKRRRGPDRGPRRDRTRPTAARARR
jgi:hypothetical protein